MGENAPGFEADIRPLFRDRDRRAMAPFFDLGAHDEVRAHAAQILERLDEGDMPCDGEWPEEQVDLFRRWIAGACQP